MSADREETEPRWLQVRILLQRDARMRHMWPSQFNQHRLWKWFQLQRHLILVLAKTDRSGDTKAELTSRDRNPELQTFTPSSWLRSPRSDSHKRLPGTPC